MGGKERKKGEKKEKKVKANINNNTYYMYAIMMCH